MLLRRPSDAKLMRRLGKLLRGTAGDPCCCGASTLFDCTCDVGCDFLRLAGFDHDAFTRPAGVTATFDDSSTASPFELASGVMAGPPRFCYHISAPIVSGMLLVSPGGAPQVGTGLRRVSTDAGCVNAYWLLEVWAYNDGSGISSAKTLIWRGRQVIANVAPDGATFVRIGGESPGPATIDLYCRQACPGDVSACPAALTLTITVRPGKPDSHNLAGIAPIPLLLTGAAWDNSLAPVGINSQQTFSLNCFGGAFEILGGADPLQAPPANVNLRWGFYGPGALVCPPAAPSLYGAVDQYAANYNAVIS